MVCCECDDPEQAKVADTGLLSVTKPEEQYESRVRNLMITTCLRNMTPVWLNKPVQHISQSFPDEEWNIIKKGWDQLYLEPIRKEDSWRQHAPHRR
jgi:hypothetical protein